MRRILYAFVFLAMGAGPRVLTPDLISDDPQSASANVVKLQSAIDRLQAESTGTQSKIMLPDRDYYFNRPIFLDGGGVGLEGAGKGITRLVMTTGHDLIVVGVPRRPNVPGGTPTIAADHFVEGLNGRVGFRTKSDHHVAQQGGSLDDFGVGIDTLTIECALDLTHLRDKGGSYALAASASLCGLSANGIPSPFELVIGNDTYYLKLRPSAGKTEQISFGTIPKSPGFVRLTAQCDLNASRVDTWINDERVTNDAKLPTTFKAFIANEHCPFGIGSNSERSNQVADHYGGASDITFLGLNVTKGLVYQSTDSLTRIDGRANSDERYVTINPNTAGYLALDEKSADVQSSRVMNVVGAGYNPSTAYVLDNAAHNSPWSSTGPGPIRHLTLTSYGRTGHGIATGFTQNLRVEDCEVSGGRFGIGSLNFGVNYPVTITDCDLSGRDSPLYLSDAPMIRIRNVNLPNGFRTGLRFVRCSGTIRDVFSTARGTYDHDIKSIGSSFDISNCSFNNEDPGAGAQISPLFFSPDPNYPTIVRVTRSNFGMYAKSAPLVILDDANAMPCRFSISDCPDVLRGNLGSGRIESRGAPWKTTKDW